MEDSSVPLYFTNSIKRCSVIGNQLNNVENLSSKEIEDILEEINHLCDDNGVVVFFLENSFHKKLITIFDQLEVKLQRIAVKILSNIIRLKDGPKASLRKDSEFLSLLTVSFTRSIQSQNHSSIQEACLKFLVEIYGKELRNLVSMDQQYLLLQSIIDSFNWGNLNMTYYSIRLLNMGFHCGTMVTRFLESNIDNVVLRLSTAETNHKMGITICKFISNALETSDSVQIFHSTIKHNLNDALMNILFDGHSTITGEYYLVAITLLNKMLLFNDTFRQTLNQCESSKEYTKSILKKYDSIIAVSLLEAVRTYNTLPILIAGLKTFYLTLSSIELLSAILNKSDQISWMSFIYEIVISNIDCMELVEWSFKVLYEMLTANNALIQSIGADSVDQLIPIDSGIIQMFYTQNNLNLATFAASCDLVSILASNSEKIQNRFLESNLHAIIHWLTIRLTNSIKYTKWDFKLRISSTNALRSLVIFNLPVKELFFNEEIHYKEAKKFLSNAFNKSHLFHSWEYYEVVAVNILFITSLVEYHPFKYDLILGKELNLSQIKICEACSLNESMVEAVQELLIVLSGSESETEFLLNVWPLDEWLSISSKLLNCYAIQKNTMIFLQLNTSKIDEGFLQQTLFKISEFIFRAVKLFKDSVVIQVEAFSLIKILMTQYPSFLKYCLEFDLDKVIFDAINLAWNQDLVKIGLQTLYMLIESNQNRVKIIEKAVQRGHLKILEFMFDFGTNIINTSTTMLLSAVKLKPVELSFQITSSLLANGCVPDSDVIIACLMAENWATAGLLLSCYRIGETEQGSCVNWSELGLETLHLTWFKRLYQGLGDLQVDRKIKWLSRRIKYEHINLMKLKSSRNEASSVQTRYPLTQSRTLENDIGGYVYHTKIKDTATMNLSKDDEQIGLFKDSMSPEFNDEISRSLGSPSVMKDRISVGRLNRMNSEYGLIGKQKKSNNTHSFDNLLINNCLTIKEINQYNYMPMLEEMEEFFMTFRSGSDYLYHPLDPRCIIRSKRRRTTGSTVISTFSSRSSLNNFIKKRSSLGEQNELGVLSSTSEMNNQSDNASETVHSVTRINQLDLSQNILMSIDVFAEISSSQKLVKMFESITVLKLQSNNIKSIPIQVFVNLVSLAQLDLSINMLTDVPWDAFRHCKLTYLNLCKNRIKTFKLSNDVKEELRSIGKVTLLKSLLLAENEILDFSISALSLFQNLERLDLQIIPLNLSNDDVLPLTNLKKLNIKNSVVSFLGKNFLNQCRDIQFIDLSENQLCHFEDMFPIRLSLFENLTNVNVSHNILACRNPFFIPKCILKIPKLQSLNISHNNIVEFPACSMWSSTVIRDLDFSHNSIHTLNLLNAKPNFQSLQNLNISYNKLKQLPPEIGHLSNLSMLNISYNPALTTLPDEIGMLKNRRFNSLILEGLNLDIKKTLSKNPKLTEILKYYHNRLKNSVEYFGLKIMVLGNSGRGKTSLLRSLQGNHKENIRTSITIGINVSKWKFQGKFNDKQVNFKFSCWDLAGQEDFYSSHECFISQRALYLVVFDLSKGIEDIHSLRPWLLNLKSQAPQAPIIIIGTHLDKIKEENRDELCLFLKTTLGKLCLAPAFPKISKFIAVDGRFPNKSIDYLKTVIIQVLEKHRIQNEPIIGEKQPASYLKLEEILQETIKTLPPQYPILMEKDLKEIVQKRNLGIDDDELKQALQFLHNCGVIVHFDDVINRLKNLYFINPQWLCSMMARIITMKALNPHINNGSMKLADFIQLFVKENFAAPLPDNVKIKEHAMQCLKILEKFDVVFQRSNNEIIIPSKLSNTKPSMTHKDDQVSKIRRLFEFCFLPTGFWPRLVTRIIVLSQSFDYLFSAPHRELHIWKQGVSMSWENSIYLLLEGRRDEVDIIDVAVTMSELGLKVLVQIIDCIEVLIEEWYPGLLDSDITGNKMMKTFALCPYCDQKFALSDVMQMSEVCDQIECPKCCDITGTRCRIDIRIIAPDLVLGDLPNYLIINPNSLKVDKNQESQIGSGGNGSVYRGRYNDENCAVKYLNAPSASSDSPSYRLLRQEIDILRRLRHSSLISLIAVDRKRMILEYASLGDLSTILKSHQLSRRFLQRVSYQIIDGIDFLHEKNILYRDLKMHNVLVFSLELSVSINVKLSDYGISRVMTYFGFVSYQGTPGYQAPEVIQKQQEYNLQSDIFSFGIVLFNIATGGKHPSDNKPHWRPGINMELISTFGCENWPRMQECIDMCLKETPDDRPAAKDMIEFISSASFISIKSVWPLTKQTRIECMVTKINEEGRVEVLLANGNQYKQEVRWVDILSGKTKGKSFHSKTKQTRVLCTALLGKVALLGTHCGKLWIYDYTEDTFKETNICFSDSILTITMMNSPDNIKIIIVGLANGTVSYKIGFSSIDDLCVDDFMHISLNDAPVTNLCLARDNAFATCGPSIYKLVYNTVEENLQEIKIVEITSKGIDKLIKCFYPVIENINNTTIISFYFSIRNQSLIYHYDDEGNQLKIPIDCDTLIRKRFGASTKLQHTKIMCMTVYGGNRYIAVGTGSGHLIVIDQKINHVSILSLYSHPIICLQHTKPEGRIYAQDKEGRTSKSIISILEKSISVDDSVFRSRSRNSWLIVVGNGYKSIDTKENDGAVLLLLSDDLSRISRQMDEHLNCRQNLKRKI